MNTADRGEEIARYAEQVRAALIDLPEVDRAALLDDLEDHLAEIAADSPEPLAARLGPPESYAAELRAAYAGRDAGAGSTRPGGPGRLRRRGARVHGSLRRLAPYRQVGDFLPRLRPAWWVLRGLLLAALVAAVVTPGWPGSLLLVPLAIVAVWASVALAGAVPTWPRLARGAYRAGDVALAVATAVAAAALAASAGRDIAPTEASATAAGVPFALVGGSGELITNIYPYTRDGRPLREVLLYDQNGRPVLIDPTIVGLELDQPCEGPPAIANSYPLKLRPWSREQSCPQRGVLPRRGLVKPIPAPVPAPSTGAPEPTASPGPTGSQSASPAPSPS